MSDKFTKLSQAIRLGATFHPQCFKAFVERNGLREAEATCALGAAYLATGGEVGQYGLNSTIVGDHLKARFPGQLNDHTLQHIINLNDVMHYSREEIADKLEAQGL